MKYREWSEELERDDEVPTLTGGRGQGLGDTMWKYEQLRAGRVYTRFMFNTRQEAEEFATQMTRVEPDLFGRIEPIEARAVWN